MTNIHGLGRDIPEPVKRMVRQRCGFGCVICASAIVEYEHFEPEFAKAREHRAEGITLLCPTCHAKRTRNLMSARRVREANAAPAALGKRYAFSEVEGTDRRPFIRLAGVTARNCETLLQVRGVPLLKVEDAEESQGPYRLTAMFFDDVGRPSLFIRRNEWAVLADSWDVEAAGASVTVRTAPREIALRLEFIPGEGLIVQRLNMRFGGFKFLGNADELQVENPQGGRNIFRQCFAEGAAVAFSFG